jgi:hypothetical protein
MQDVGAGREASHNPTTQITDIDICGSPRDWDAMATRSQ